jgi:ferredoxin
MQAFDAQWPAALAELSAEMHPIDRDACLIWFQYFPLELHHLLETTPDRAALDLFYKFRGSYRLAEIADTSHRFLFGHQYWPAVKQALRQLETRPTLLETIRAVAAKVDGPRGLTLPISAIGLMTLRQAGSAFLETAYTLPAETRTLEKALSARATGSKTGGLFKLLSKPKPRIIIDERSPEGWFPLVPGQHITTAAELDKKPYHETNLRCSPGNGPIPVDCRSGTCGTCWIGILGANEKLSPVEPFERRRMDYFGYGESPFHNSEAPRPLIRLACQTIATETCTIVIPPWNGIWSAARREAFARRPA